MSAEAAVARASSRREGDRGEAGMLSSVCTVCSVRGEAEDTPDCGAGDSLYCGAGVSPALSSNKLPINIPMSMSEGVMTQIICLTRCQGG